MSAISDLTRQHRFAGKWTLHHQCWEWTGSKGANGYGIFMWDAGPPKRTCTAHRAAYRLFIGEIPDGYEVDHLCRRRSCVNPEHLEAIPLAENRRRRDTPSGKRHWNGKKTHCKNGHPFSGANLSVDINGARICVTCRREYQREYQRARRS